MPSDPAYQQAEMDEAADQELPAVAQMKDALGQLIEQMMATGRMEGSYDLTWDGGIAATVTIEFRHVDDEEDV